MPRYILRSEEKERYGDSRRMLRALLEEGLRTKVSEMRRDDYRKRLEEEVYVIESTNNVDYFLIQWDMVAEARRRGIATGVGRGSAGGSLVSYLLGITSIDPVAYDLLFSRFLVPERCGLNWVEEITVLGEDVSVEAGSSYVEITIGGFHQSTIYIGIPDTHGLPGLFDGYTLYFHRPFKFHNTSRRSKRISSPSRSRSA